MSTDWFLIAYDHGERAPDADPRLVSVRRRVFAHLAGQTREQVEQLLLELGQTVCPSRPAVQIVARAAAELPELTRAAWRREARIAAASRDDLTVWLAALAGGEAAEPGEVTTAPPLSLDDEELAVLRALQRAEPRLLRIIDLEADGDCPSNRIIGERVNTLIGCGLAARPKGPKRGATITQAGRDLLARLAER